MMTSRDTCARFRAPEAILESYRARLDEVVERQDRGELIKEEDAALLFLVGTILRDALQRPPAAGPDSYGASELIHRGAAARDN